MIYDTLHNARLYEGLGPGFQRAFAYLTSNDLAALAPGRYDIDGNQVYLMIQEPELKAWDQGRWEAHRRYADIQLVLAGSERIGFCSVSSAPVETPYSPENDILFYQEMPGNEALVRAGEMMILFPQDAHKPCIRPHGGGDKVRKAVVKVLL